MYQRPAKRKVNSSMYIPRASREVQENPEFYQLLCETYEDLLVSQSVQVLFKLLTNKFPSDCLLF